MLCLQYELLNVSANEMIGKTDLYNEGRNGVSHQCVLLNVTVPFENLQSFLYRGSTHMSCLQNELSYVRANKMIGNTTLYTRDTCEVSLQCELLNVSANSTIRKTTLYTGGRYVVSHQYELLNVSARLENLQSFLYRGSTQMLCLQYELSYVRANYMIGKTT